MDVYQRMKEKDIVLPNAPAKGGIYAPAREFGDGYVYLSGCGPALGRDVVGKLGAEYTVEQGRALARDCMLNALAVLQAAIGDLNRVKAVVKILTLVASADDFYRQPEVANGGSQLLVDVFGEEVGLAARSAIGVNALPGNIPVETEVLVELR